MIKSLSQSVSSYKKVWNSAHLFYNFKGALDKCHNIGQIFYEKVEILIQLEVLTSLMTAYGFLPSRLAYFKEI